MPREKQVNGRWLGGVREKTCQHCGSLFQWKSGQIYTNWIKRKFCSKPCQVAGQKRLYGSEHPRFNPNSRRKSRGAGHYFKWQQAVLARDKATCRRCDISQVELHAHHIKAWKDFPELRFDVENGITLCHRCHWWAHSAGNENSVNSVEALTAPAEGDAEPSSDRKIIEGVTTRGRAFRRIEAKCEWCGTFISRTWGQARKSKHLFCGYSCGGKYKQSVRKRRTPMAVIPSTSAGPEREDIV